MCVLKRVAFFYLACFQSVVQDVDCVEECVYDNDCNDGFTYKIHCCNRRNEDNICKSNCIRESCSYNSDCAPWECCGSDHICKSSGCATDDLTSTALEDWLIIVIVFGVLLVVFLPIIVVMCICYRSAGSPRRSLCPCDLRNKPKHTDKKREEKATKEPQFELDIFPPNQV